MMMMVVVVTVAVQRLRVLFEIYSELQNDQSLPIYIKYDY